jgi:hypothetical protein
MVQGRSSPLSPISDNVVSSICRRSEGGCSPGVLEGLMPDQVVSPTANERKGWTHEGTPCGMGLGRVPAGRSVRGPTECEDPASGWLKLVRTPASAGQRRLPPRHRGVPQDGGELIRDVYRPPRGLKRIALRISRAGSRSRGRPRPGIRGSPLSARPGQVSIRSSRR